MKSFVHLLIIFVIGLASKGLMAQSLINPSKCASMHSLEEDFKLHPELRAQHEKVQQKIGDHVKNSSGEKSEDVRIIPVVFHIIHECGPENISKAQIDDQIRILNEDFSLQNENFSLVPEGFADLAADSKIEFRLASKDDLGNCTDGIVRVFSPKANDASNRNGFKALSHWNSYKYLNVWVVKSIASFVTTQGTVLGYAQFPGGGFLSTDGIVLRHDYTGSIGTAAGRVGRTATHEIGHWLGLRHIWGDADCGSDGVDDTPIAEGPNFGVCWGDYPYLSSCPGADSINGEMFMNYMDYSDDNCMAMFTMGQLEVMNGVLGEFRRNIWSEENLIATGTTDEDVLNPQVCAPKANFCENRRLICAGSSITFEDASYNAEDYTRAWEFEGGDPATSTSANPNVDYDIPGKFQVKLTVNNEEGESELVKTSWVTISPDEAENQQGPFTDFLDIEADFLSRYIIENSDNSDNKWEFFYGVGFNSAEIYNDCIRMRNYNNTPTEKDAFITPSYNISSIGSPSMIFRIAGAERGGEPNDQLRVSTSTNCGQTWVPRKLWTGSELVTAGYFSSEFVPTETNQWSELAVSLASVASQDNVRFKFEFTAGDEGSNNLYIDDIRIGQSLSIESLKDLVGLNVFPNPANQRINVQFTAEKQGTAQIRVIDLLGKSVVEPIISNVHNGSQSFDISLVSVSAGLYTVELEIDGVKFHRKLIKN